MSTEKIRIRIKAYDHRILDNAAKKIVETVKRSGGEVSGPVPLPTEIEKFTILRAVHKYKDSREQFEMRTHKRLIDVKNHSKETIDALAHLDLPSGVDIEIKTKFSTMTSSGCRVIARLTGCVRMCFRMTGT